MTKTILRWLLLSARPAPAVQSAVQPAADIVDVTIAKRSAECRRSEAVAQSYRQIHTELKQGLRK